MLDFKDSNYNTAALLKKITEGLIRCYQKMKLLGI